MPIDDITAGIALLFLLHLLIMPTHPRRGSHYTRPPVDRAQRPAPPPAPPRKR
jgi:hypothetical protein